MGTTTIEKLTGNQRATNHKSAKELRAQGYEVTSPEQKEARKKWIANKDTKHWSWQNTLMYISQRDNLTPIQRGSLLIMSTFLDNNGEGKLHDSIGGELTVIKFAKLIEKSVRTAKRIIEECENIGALTTHKEGKETVISFTDMLYICGKLPSDKEMKYVKVFKTSVRALVKDFKLNEIGFLADVLPHFHHENHILCENPTWNGTDGMEVWRRVDIVENLHYEKKFVSATIMKFIRNGVMLELRGRRDVLYLHPDIARRSPEKCIPEEVEKVACSVADDPKVKYTR
ncbi:hypothetical protein COF37_21395 [Bacillus wiedmannii]|uniref:hypothetical protein n=1 Tax=Bacillus wiedmannii TaxID=1890302 RepID=UPI000BFBFCEF|nr:hypothetical protein [Bacillus wiedmannii]PHD21294.1 hypothetical protein COF37_21395 [Bacillus wiedmannii]